MSIHWLSDYLLILITHWLIIWLFYLLITKFGEKKHVYPLIIHWLSDIYARFTCIRMTHLDVWMVSQRSHSSFTYKVVTPKYV